MSLVNLLCGVFEMKAIVLDTPQNANYLKENNSVKAIFKETEVVIGLKSNDNLSLQNQIPGIVSSLNKGALLTEVTLDTTIGIIKSIITSSAVSRLKLSTGIEAIAMIKTNEVMLSE